MISFICFGGNLRIYSIKKLLKPNKKEQQLNYYLIIFFGKAVFYCKNFRS